jgi:hypothetical protein
VSIKIFNLEEGLYQYVGKEYLGYFSLGDLYGLDVHLTWDPTILNHTGHVATVPVENYPNGAIHSPILWISEEGGEVDEVTGKYRIACTSMGGSPFNNPGASNTIFNITFTVIAEGSCPLNFSFVDLSAKVNVDAKPIRGLNTLLPEPDSMKPGFFSSTPAGNRDISVKSVQPSPQYILAGGIVTINATVSNLGWTSENFTAAAYYNQSLIQWDDILGTGEWEKIGEEGVTRLKPATSRRLTFQWNTTGVLDVGVTESLFIILVNVTRYPEESNLTNNLNWATVRVTSEQVHDVAVTQIAFPDFGSPLIAGEVATIRMTLANHGTVMETFNVTLYRKLDGDTLVIHTKLISKMPPGSKTVSASWNTAGVTPRLHTLVAEASVVEDEAFTENNILEQQIRIIETPDLDVIASPGTFEGLDENLGWYEWTVPLNETVSFNASASVHEDPNGNITNYQWKVTYAGKTIQTHEGLVVEYVFNGTGWLVQLVVTDNYDITYQKDRPQTGAYRQLIYIGIEEEKPDGGIPIYIYAAVAVIIIVVLSVSVYILKARR